VNKLNATISKAWAKCYTCGRERQLPRGKNCDRCICKARWKREAKKQGLTVKELASHYCSIASFQCFPDWTMWISPWTVQEKGLD